MKKMMFCIILVGCCFLLGACKSNSFRTAFFMQNDEDIINPYFEKFITGVNNRDAKMLHSLFAVSISDDTSSLMEQIESSFSYFPESLLITTSACGIHTSSSMNENRCTKIDARFAVEANGQTFYAAMKICSEDTANSDNVGIMSIYFINAEDYHSDANYLGDGKWTPGINLQ